jgi:hypothetical protein
MIVFTALDRSIYLPVWDIEAAERPLQSKGA